MSFESNIKDWVSIDNQIKLLNDKVRELRLQRTEASDEILHYVETNNLSNATIQISDGRLKFSETKHTAPLTLKYINDCLVRCLTDTEKIAQIMHHIKTSREIKMINDIKRTYC
tara:strand:- start:333 stop:674 length:342 start_codon:yes stop_codon:yes gene_type:complete